MWKIGIACMHKGHCSNKATWPFLDGIRGIELQKMALILTWLRVHHLRIPITAQMAFWAGWVCWSDKTERHLKKTLKVRTKRFVTFETLDQSDVETWPDQQKTMTMTKTKTMTKTFREHTRDLWPLRHWIRVIRRHDLSNRQTLTKTKTFRKQHKRMIPETYKL